MLCSCKFASVETAVYVRPSGMMRELDDEYKVRRRKNTRTMYAGSLG
jgi:hypothetical protein